MNTLALNATEVNPADDFELVEFIPADEFTANPIDFDDDTDAEYDAWLDTHADEMGDEAEALEMVCSGSRPW